MSLFVESQLLKLKGAFEGDRCFIVGSGPSLDVFDLRKLQGEHVLALNSSITLFAKHKPLWWIFRDTRVVYEVEERWPKLDALRVVAGEKASTRFKNRIPVARMPRSTVLHAYRPEEFVHQRTIVEDAIQIAEYAGFAEAYLVGIDHALSKDGEPYAKALAWKDCYFYDVKRPKAKSLGLESMVRAMQDLKVHLKRIKVFNCSPFYPREVFPRADFDEVTKRAHAG